MREVIARKCRKNNGFIFGLSFGFTFVGIGVCLICLTFFKIDIEALVYGIITLVIGILVFVASVAGYFTFKRCPQTIISFESGRFYFPKGFSCLASEITNSSYTLEYETDGEGEITIFIGEKKLIFYHIVDAMTAFNRLQELIHASKKENPNCENGENNG